MHEQENLVLIPGLNNTEIIWHDMLQYLPDWITAYPTECPTLDNVDDIAAALLKTLPDKFYLCGFSFGGYVALSILENHPHRVKGLILAGTSAQADNDLQIKARTGVIEKLKTHDYIDFVNQQVSKAFHVMNLGNTHIMDTRQEMIENYGKTRFIAHLKACITRPNRAYLIPQMAIPFLVLSGSEDQVISPQSQQSMFNEAVCSIHAQFHSISNAGHLVPLECPSEFSNKITLWILSLLKRS